MKSRYPPYKDNPEGRVTPMSSKFRSKEFTRFFFLMAVCSSLLVACGISDEDRNQVRDFTYETATWGKQLDLNGRKTIEIILGLIRANETDFNALRKHLKESNEYIASGIRDFSSRDLPSFAENYQSTLIDYLQWQISSEEETIPKVEAIVKDKRLSGQERAKKVVEVFKSLENQEEKWKARIETEYDFSIRPVIE